MSKRTLFLIFALFVITGVLLMMALYNPNAKPAATKIIQTSEKQIAQTILSFGNIVSSPSAAYSVPINITGTNKVTAVQLEMQYDPEVLTNVAVVPGVFFKNPTILLNQIDQKTGRISYAFGINPTDQGVMGNGVIATLSFTAKTQAPMQTHIMFLPKTLVTAENTNESVLKQANAAQFTVGTVPATTSNDSSPNAQ